MSLLQWYWEVWRARHWVWRAKQQDDPFVMGMAKLQLERLEGSKP